MSTTTTTPAATTVTRESRPFAWLNSATSMSQTAIRGLPDLRQLTEESISVLARALAEYSLRSQRPLDLVSDRRTPLVSVRNRRRRAASLWIVSVLGGRCDASTLDSLVGTWLPQLAGSGPDRRVAARSGRRLIEFLRGLITADLFAAAAPNLVPQAHALCALDGVLAVHLDAIERQMAVR